MRINEEVVNGEFYFYHSTKNLNAALYIINKEWKTGLGMYGLGIYGQQYPDPTSKQNDLSPSSIRRYKDLYGGSYRFKIKYTNPKDMFYLDIDAGKQVYPGYNKTMGKKILKDHNVPKEIIDNISMFFSEGNNKPPLSRSMLSTDRVEGGLLGKYGFKGLVYNGNQDGASAVFWYPNNSTLDVVAYSTDFGKTWTDYDSSNIKQVDELRAEIQEQIDRYAGGISARQQEISRTGRIPALDAQGADRDWIRIIECGIKAGYDFNNNDYTSGNIRKFADLVQRQINASKEPKRSNRYNIAIKIMPEVAQYLTL